MAKHSHSSARGTLTGTPRSEADMSPQNHGSPGLPAGDGAVPVLEGELALLQLHDEPGQVLWGPGGIKNTCQRWLCPEGGLADTRRRPKATPATGGSQAWGGLGPVHRPRSSGVWSCALTATWAHTASRWPRNTGHTTFISPDFTSPVKIGSIHNNVTMQRIWSEV